MLKVFALVCLIVVCQVSRNFACCESERSSQVICDQDGGFVS